MGPDAGAGVAAGAAGGTAVVIDASPDLREQIDRYLPPLGLRSLRAIFITHGHVGHYWGLPLLGREGPDLKGVAVRATPDVLAMLSAIPAVSLMASSGNIQMQPISPGDPARIDNLEISAFYVPHRQELTRTVAFRIRGPEKSLVYIPDIDRWTPEVVGLIRCADVALLDGTFFSAGELGGARSMSEIPHPPIAQSLEVLGGTAQAIYFTHLNHTNPAGLEGPERAAIRRASMDVAADGMRIRI